MLTPLLSGCALFIAAGAGGAYSYFAGNLTRTYDAEYYRAVRVSSGVMRQLNFRVTGKTGDALKTVIEGKRADDTPVTIKVERVESGLTKIGVRNGLVGVGNLKASEKIHERIGRQLKKQYVAKKQTPATENEKNSTNPAGTEAPDIVLQSTPKKKDPTLDGPTPLRSMATSETENAGVLPKATSVKPQYIYYTNSETAIPSSAFAALDKIADYLLKNPASSLDIRGYTDSRGDPENNKEISQKRADSIRDYLAGKGVAVDQLTAHGYGASNFIESNRTEKLRSMNRRIELYIQ